MNLVVWWLHWSIIVEWPQGSAWHNLRWPRCAGSWQLSFPGTQQNLFPSFQRVHPKGALELEVPWRCPWGLPTDTLGRIHSSHSHLYGYRTIKTGCDSVKSFFPPQVSCMWYHGLASSLPSYIWQRPEVEAWLCLSVYLAQHSISAHPNSNQDHWPSSWGSSGLPFTMVSWSEIQLSVGSARYSHTESVFWVRMSLLGSSVPIRSLRPGMVGGGFPGPKVHSLWSGCSPIPTNSPWPALISNCQKWLFFFQCCLPHSARVSWK